MRSNLDEKLILVVYRHKILFNTFQPDYNLFYSYSGNMVHSQSENWIHLYFGFVNICLES